MTPAPITTEHLGSALRRLPLPARVVIAVFLIAVGLGYFSALVQLHLQHSARDGSPLPGTERVVEIFAGVRKHDPNAPPPVSRLERLVMGPREGAPWNGSGSMAPAFFERDDGTYRAILRDEPEQKAKLDAERDGERLSVQAWIRLPEADRKVLFDADRMPRPATAKLLTEDFLSGEAVKIRSLMTERCARCHSTDGEQANYPLETYEQIAKYLEVPSEEPDARGWVRTGTQMSVEKLAQSTHAHLLSFAMLFGITGFLFALTSYPVVVRLGLAPAVLIAQVLDISCWWLARVPEHGPYFAMAIPITGGIVGLGLCLQILGTLFDLFGRGGRLILIALLLLAAGGMGVLYSQAIAPALDAQK